MNEPLSQNEFNRQVEALFETYGASAFAALASQYPKYTLFVEDDKVVAESAESPRHRYGAFCELDHALSGTALDDRVRQWLSSGEAYSLYLSMNVCRYNC
jgi:hypothetical protein